MNTSTQQPASAEIRELTHDELDAIGGGKLNLEPIKHTINDVIDAIGGWLERLLQ
jgi:hypothetical protein